MTLFTVLIIIASSIPQTAREAIARRVCIVALPTWGRRATFFSSVRPGVRAGSFSYISRPAIAMRSDRSASKSANSTPQGLVTH